MSAHVMQSGEPQKYLPEDEVGGWCFDLQVVIPDGTPRTEVQSKVYELVATVLDGIEAA